MVCTVEPAVPAVQAVNEFSRTERQATHLVNKERFIYQPRRSLQVILSTEEGAQIDSENKTGNLSCSSGITTLLRDNKSLPSYFSHII